MQGCARLTIRDIHKLPSTLFQALVLPVSPHPCRYAGNFNSPTQTRNTIPTAEMECVRFDRIIRRCLAPQPHLQFPEVAA